MTTPSPSHSSSHSPSPYDRVFFDALEGSSAPSARAIVPLLLEELAPESVVDVGCGRGVWLSVFAECGVTELLGLDGGEIDPATLAIPPERFRAADLRQPLPVQGPFSLAISLEVAEHLPPARAPGFVAELARLAPVVVFSAAVPGQGGDGHVNEQWPAYWSRLFAQAGLRCVDWLRPRLWDDPRVAWWYRQNTLLFATPQVLADHPALAARVCEVDPPALVHPQLFEQYVTSSRRTLGQRARDLARHLQWRIRERRRRGRS